MVKILGRELANVAGAPFQRQHYVAAVNILRKCRAPLRFMRRYVAGGGGFPDEITVSTPSGDLGLFVYSRFDIKTVNEVFFRHDYAATGGEKVVIDIGSNIGVSAAWFLSQSPDAFVHLFEPNPDNHARIERQLARFAGRWELNRAGVAGRDGSLKFYFEESGRFGTADIGSKGDHDYVEMDVEVRGINRVLESVLAERDVIDVIKIDVEGLEQEIIEAIEPAHRDRIRLIYAEMDGRGVRLDGFAYRQYGSVAVFTGAAAR